MKYSEDIKLEIGGKFINGDYNKKLKLLTKDLDKLIKSAKSEQLLIHSVVVPKGTLCECKQLSLKDFIKLADKHLFVLETPRNAFGGTKLKVFGIEKLYKQLLLHDVSKSFTAKQVADMLVKDFATIEEAIAYFDTIK